MIISVRNLLVLLTVGLIAFVAVPFVRSLLFDLLFVGRTFTSSSAWLNPLALFEWLFYLLAFIPLGYVLSHYLASRRPWVWPLVLGVLYGCFLVAFTQHYFFDTSTAIDYALIYGEYLMPLAGALAGSLLHRFTLRQQTGA